MLLNFVDDYGSVILEAKRKTAEGEELEPKPSKKLNSKNL